MDLLLGSLSEDELELVREADPGRLAGLDEDALIKLHNRVRRARNKHVKVYRRRAATRVAEAGGRGKARPQNSRKRAKAEVFETILATVSRHLALAAQASAESLEAERHAEERTGRGVAAGPPPVVRLSPQRTDHRPKSVEFTKRHASTRAKGARRQARKDSR